MLNASNFFDNFGLKSELDSTLSLRFGRYRHIDGLRINEPRRTLCKSDFKKILKLA